VGSCGNIVITGGNITATGFNDYGSGGSAGIGTGSASSGVCGTITITDGIERLAITKAGNAQAVVGKGNASSTVGTITIDGVADPTAESSFPHLSLAVSNGGKTWIFTPKTGPSSLADLKDMVNADEDCSAYLGYYVYSDGNIGTDATDAIGLVAYMSKTATQVTSIDESCRILVLGLTDLSSGTDLGSAGTLCNNLGKAISTVDWSIWRLPTTGQWRAVCQSDGLGQGRFLNLCGDESLAKLSSTTEYWTSTFKQSDAYDYGYNWTVKYAETGNDGNIPDMYWNWARSDYNRGVRAVFGY
jgi:hypothetical protein